MAISHVGDNAGNGFSSSRSVTIDLPSGAQPDDIVVAVLATDTLHALTAGTPPADWDLVGTTQDDGTDSSTTVLIHRVEDNPPASWSLTDVFASLEAGVALASAYRGVNLETPVTNVVQGRQSASTSHVTGTITPDNANSMIVTALGCDPGINPVVGTPTGSPLATKRVEANNGLLGWAHISDFLQGAAAAVQFSFTLSGSESISLITFALKSATGDAPVNTVEPAITGTPTEGQTLTTDDGTWDGDPFEFAYQWQRDGDGDFSFGDIVGETTNSYPLVTEDVGCHIRCLVAATNEAGTTIAFSEITATVEAIGAFFQFAPRGGIVLCGRIDFFYESLGLPDDPPPPPASNATTPGSGSASADKTGPVNLVYLDRKDRGEVAVGFSFTGDAEVFTVK